MQLPVALDKLASTIEAMERFASTARSDDVSVNVARVADRLAHCGAPFEKPLTKRELAIIRTFQ